MASSSLVYCYGSKSVSEILGEDTIDRQDEELSTVHMNLSTNNTFTVPPGIEVIIIIIITVMYIV